MRTCIMLAVAAASLAASAFFPRPAAGQPAAGAARALVVYFSWSGNTAAIAELIHQRVGGDLLRLVPAKPYSSDYNECLDEAKRDQELGARPELATVIPDLAGYDVVYLGYPNWWATIPMPIATFLEGRDLGGKIIAPFCSHGGGRLGQSVTDIAKLAPDAVVVEGLSVHYRGGRSLAGDVDAWLARVAARLDARRGTGR